MTQEEYIHGKEKVKRELHSIIDKIHDFIITQSIDRYHCQEAMSELNMIKLELNELIDLAGITKSKYKTEYKTEVNKLKIKYKDAGVPLVIAEAKAKHDCRLILTSELEWGNELNSLKRLWDMAEKEILLVSQSWANLRTTY